MPGRRGAAYLTVLLGMVGVVLGAASLLAQGPATATDDVWTRILGLLGIPGAVMSGVVSFAALRWLKSGPAGAEQIRAQIETGFAKLADALSEQRENIKADTRDVVTGLLLQERIKELERQELEQRLRDLDG